MAPAEISRPVVRRALDQCLRVASDLDAFLLDYFPKVHRELGSAMDRTARVNLLLQHESGEAILRALTDRFAEEPSTLAKLRALQGAAPPGPAEPPPATATAAPAGSRAPIIYLEVADTDRALVSELVVHLRPAERQGQVQLCHRGAIAAGVNYRAELAAQLQRAAVIVPVVSAALLAGDEFAPFVQTALQRNAAGAFLIPLLARPALWEATPLSPLEPLPRTRRFLSTLSASEREETLSAIAQTLLQSAQSRASRSPS